MTAVLEQPQHPRLKRWTKAEYLRLVESGAFDEDGHYYLFRGEILDMSPMGSPHSISMMKATAVLSRAIASHSGEQFLRVQLPFDAPGDSIPEPDLAICTHAQAFVLPYPSAALLVIEIAETSLKHDREKAFEYAAAQVPEYWIVDLNGRQVEVHRNPTPDRTAPLGVRYAAPTVVKSGEVVNSIAIPSMSVKVVDLLP